MPSRSLAAGVALAALLAATAASSQTLNDLLRRSVEDALRNATRPAPPAPVPVPPQPASQPAAQPASPSDPAQGGGAPSAPAGTPPVAAPSDAAPPGVVPPAAAPPAAVPPAAAPPAAVQPTAAPPIATPVPVSQPPVVAATAPPGVQGLEARVADGPRTVDLRTGTPPGLEGRYLPPDGLVVVANPYVPEDRRFVDRPIAMACHPQGGLVLLARSWRWEPSPQRGPGREYAENGTGLWRVEPDGRVRPLWVPVGRQVDDRFSNCGVPAPRARMPEGTRANGLAVEPSGGVLVASSSLRTIVRLRPDGVVEHVAGGGPGYCASNPTSRLPASGLRDGPGPEALFSGELAIAVDPREGTIWVSENGHADGRTPPNCALRRIDASGTVSTVRGGRCPDVETERTSGHRSVGHEQVALDGQGRPLLLGVSRARREGVGPAELIYTKVHRVEGERDELLARAGHGARFDPVGRLVSIGRGPDGAPLAWNAGHYSDAGLIAMSTGPQLRYAWRSGPGTSQQYVDGPRGQARVFEARSFCTGTDGRVYVLTDRAVRRIDTATGAVDTWLH